MDRGFGDGDDAGDGKGDGDGNAVWTDYLPNYGYGDGGGHGVMLHDGNGKGWGNGTDPAFILKTTRSFDGHLINLYIKGLIL